MDFGTRDRYRHVVERLARGSGLSEGEVARATVRLAQEAPVAPHDRSRHVGYYLVDRGLPRLEGVAGVRWSPARALARAASRAPELLYLGGIWLLTMLLAGAFVVRARTDGAPDWLLALAGALSLLAASSLAVALVNWLVTVLKTPHVLPRMDFSAGIPPESRTLVVVPAMLTSEGQIEELAEALEVRSDAGTSRKASGWDTSASGGSSGSSTTSCAAARRIASRSSSGRRRCSPT
jgi:hypothetical protein